MADFLASLNLQSQAPSQPDDRPCVSIEELQSRLRDSLSTKVTETRAERVAIKLDLSAATQLTLGLSDGENEVLEGLNNIDPSLGGVRSTGIAGEGNDGEASRMVSLNDALMNQPSDDPVLQRSVAKVIISSVSATDGSEWLVRDVSRDSQGWTFTYMCKGSFQNWKRQSKPNNIAVIGEYSKGEPDPYLSSRPAFDCRGSVSISFFRSNKAVSVLYDHIPLHKTVADLAAFFKPASPQYPVPTEKQKTPKTPKQPGSSRKKRDTDKTPGDSAKPRKRARKTGDANNPEGSNVADSAVSSQAEGSQNVVGQQARDFTQTDGSVEQLQSLVENGAHASPSQGNHDTGQPPVNGLAINVSPEEAERRQNVADVMLREAGVNPDTLSTEQFNIFANQSPELQKESLNMLVKYGAERLRIVHPSNKDGPPSSSNNSASNTSAQSNVQTSPSGPVTTNELVLQTQGKSRMKSKTLATNGDGAGDSEAGTPTMSRRRGPTKSRVACFQCKQRRVKCPKNKPICTECEAAGVNCEFPLPKPRKRKSEAIITTEDEQDEDAQGEEMQPQDEVQDQDYSEMPDNSVHSQADVADLLTTNINTTDWGQNQAHQDYLQSPSSLAINDGNSPQPSHQANTSSPGLILPQERMYYPPVPGTEISEQPLPQATSPQAEKSYMSSSAPSSRHNMAPRPSRRDSQHSLSVNPATASDWSSGGNSVTQAGTATAALPTSTSTQDQNSGEPGYPIQDSSAPPHGAWRAAVLSQAALSQAVVEDPQQQGIVTSRQSPIMPSQQQPAVASAPLQRQGAQSPLDRSPRAKSRQSHRAARSSLHNDPLSTPLIVDQTNNLAATRQTTANYDSYERYSNTGNTSDASANRITYEPYSYQKDSSDVVSYGNYGQASHPTTTTSTLSQAATAMAPSDNSSSRHYSYPSQQGRTAAHGNASYVDSRQNTQTQSISSDQSRSGRQNFNMRPQPPASRSNEGSSKQTPERSYSPYPTQLQPQQHQSRQPMQQTSQQSNQQQGWYNYNNNQNNNSFSSSDQGSNYSWSMPGES